MGKKIGIWPFYSQHDKATGKTLLATCGATKQMSYLARKLRERGDVVNVIVPNGSYAPEFDGCVKKHHTIHTHNPTQRIHWNTDKLYSAFHDCDTVLCNHEYGAIPLRTMFPSKNIIQMCAVKPDSLLFVEAWRAANLRVVHTEVMRQHVYKAVGTQLTEVWPMRYDAERLNVQPAHDKAVDVLFVQRCSSTNYTKHVEFLQAMESYKHLKVAFTDVTKYLRNIRPELCYTSPETYNTVMRSSKVVVALNDDGFGGQAVVEAIACGCIPVLLDAPCYRELVDGHPGGWPYFVKPDLTNLGEVIYNAWCGCTDNAVVRARAMLCSYQRTWEIARDSL